MPMEWAQEDINEYVTEMCNCDSAAYYQRKKKQKERAHERVLFPSGSVLHFNVKSMVFSMGIRKAEITYPGFHSHLFQLCCFRFVSATAIWNMMQPL